MAARRRDKPSRISMRGFARTTIRRSSLPCAMKRTCCGRLTRSSLAIPANFRFTEFPSQSKTTSTLQACQQLPPVRPMHIWLRVTQRQSRGCAPRAQSSLARPISTSSPPGWSARDLPTGFHATPFARASFQVDRARARPWPLLPDSCPLPWALTLQGQAASRPCSTTSSA